MIMARASVSELDGSSLSSTAERYTRIRELTLKLVEPLTDADATVQSMRDTSPAKWHLAHTTWFFETFLLRDHVPGYRLHDARWQYLFNSYYEAEGVRVARDRRGMLTRPTLAEVIDYRTRVDDALRHALPVLAERCPELIELGLNHEQQHQELLLTDIKHLFFCNPLGPALWLGSETSHSDSRAAPSLRWHAGPTGLVETGYGGDGFAFDCETPAHAHFLTPYALADRPITAGEWIEFIDDGGYSTPLLWLADGWDWVTRNRISAPLYWEDADGWRNFTLAGWRSVQPAAPVSHISFYEADAFATWAGARLPSEAEWEAIAAAYDSAGGNQLDHAGAVGPLPEFATAGLASLFGNVWEWTGSAYRPYPGFRPARGAVGEYNGKFMSGQFVLKGGSCATPRGHMRASYRNFFYPHQRWQFTGLRLAKDL
jgi:ergothioneine biosynthesis protein EgtB